MCADNKQSEKATYCLTLTTETFEKGEAPQTAKINNCQRFGVVKNEKEVECQRISGQRTIGQDVSWRIRDITSLVKPKEVRQKQMLMGTTHSGSWNGSTGP